MATAMLFGPEWMRSKQNAAPVRPPPPPSPPLALPFNGNANAHLPAPPGASSYSSLVTPTPVHAPAKQDASHPFKYSKDEMLAVWKESGGGGPLPIEVERWEGVICEDTVDPACAREMNDEEKRLFSAPLNSEARRRQQSTDFSGQGDRPKLNSARSTTGGGSMGDGLGVLGRRRRGDGSGPDPGQPPLPRKSSWSASTPGSTGPGVPRTARFEGVLNGGDSGPWGTGKRRISSTNVSKSDNSDTEAASEGVIKEVPDGQELNGGNPLSTKVDMQHSERGPSPLAESRKPFEGLHSVDALTDTNGLKAVPIEPERLQQTNGESQSLSVVEAIPPTNAINPFKVSWIYLDPSGQIQGPFPAETMQTWHEQHYFTDDLRMKRVDIDQDWIAVSDIKTRALGERTFLSQLSDVSPPPGLSRLGFGIPRNGIYRDTALLDSPQQPTPQPFVGAQFTMNSTSPASSFGVPAYGSISASPDPLVLNSRLGNAVYESPLNGRNFGSPSAALLGQVPGHGNMNDSFLRTQSANGEFPRTIPDSFDSLSSGNNPLLNIPWQAPLVNQMNNWDHQVSNSAFPHQPGTAFNDAIAPFNARIGGHQAQGADFFQPSGPPSSHFSHRPSVDFSGRAISGQHEVGGVVNQGISGPLQPLSMPIRSASHRQSPTLSSPVIQSPAIASTANIMQTRQTGSHSPWGTVRQETSDRLPRPFESDHPRSSNTVISGPSTTTASQRTAWVKDDLSISTSQNIPWLTGDGLSAGKNTGDIAEEPQSLTTANVMKHEKEQQQLLEKKETPGTHPSDPTIPPVTISPGEDEQQLKTATTFVAESTVPETPAKPSQSSKRKQSTIAIPITQTTEKEKTESAAALAAQVKPVTPSSQPKSAWVVSEEPAVKTPVPMGLREIQEAEMKKQEARRLAEKERERASRAVVSNGAAQTDESSQAFSTTSWGLPTSLVGTRNVGVPGRDASTTPNSQAAASSAVWTNATPTTAKKSMKEIQEEEERRKAFALKESVSAAAKKSVAAAAASKVATATNIGGAWTVVGSGGKMTSGTPTPTRPSVTSQTSTPSVTPAKHATTPSRAAPSPQVVKPTTPAPPKVVVEEIPGPSGEFMKWLRESLRGLNSSVQFEEIAQMLLSFPLDPDPSMVEIIAETVYGASTTLDGKRFASEFVAKRKADASRPRGTPGQLGSNGKPSSLADVVRTQPKPAPEFTPFKVVKKKGKRS